MTVAAQPAFAQAAGELGNLEAEEPAGVIVVTGSRIARPDLDTAAPVAVVGEEEFQLSGSVNVESVINTLPQVVPGLTGFSNNPGNGAATLNLRGLGETRTMVLVNSRRWMFYDTNQIVDLNTIPQFLIDSVDVVTGGASAVYGSDAIAGVVNFKLRDDLDGLLIGGQTNITEEGDGFRYNLDMAIGSDLADGRGHVTVWASYARRKPIFQSAREFSRFAAVDGCIVPGSVDGTGTGIEVDCDEGVPGPVRGGSSGVPTTYVDALGAQFADTGGTLVPFSPYNYAPANYLQLPQERYMVGGYADYEINDNVTAYAEVSYVNNVVPQELAATPAFITSELDVDSPFFAPGVQNQLAALDTDGDGYVTSLVRRRLLETGSRNSNDERNAFRVLAGVKGDIVPGWGYDAYYMYSRTRNSQIQTGNISVSRFLQALRTEFDANGNLVCSDQSNGCTPLNIFGLGTISPEAADFIRIRAQNTEISSLQVASAAINGELFDLPGGPLGVAFGAEYRKVSSQYIPDTALASGDVAGFNAGLPTQGSYDVKELFGEIYLPIITDGFVDRFEITAAGRYSDYSLDAIGGTWTYAIGATLSPIRDITIRGQYQRAVRAPNVEELFGGNSQGFPPASDPCSSRNVDNRTDAVRDLCIATGVPANAVFTDAIQLNSQIEGLFGGNPDLEEEVSDSWTAGVVLQPSFIPRLAITIDYFDIKVENLITTLGGGLNNSLSLCYYTVQDINSEYCQAINRFGSGAIDNVEILNANIAELETSGVDLQIDYSTPVGFSLYGEAESQLSFFFLGTWTDKNNFTPVADLPDQVNICAGYYGATCGTFQPEYKFTTRITWQDGPQRLSFRGRYIGSGDDDQIVNQGVDPANLAVAGLSERFYLDMTLAFEVQEDRVVTFGVNNLLNTKPPLTGDSQQQANTFPNVYDVLGRDFFVSFRAEF
ncbi:TonB-dependent receptor [Novosphingobium marinum]|uniref:Outer membrane receptor protein involved in Fe transport n=1 Tax=Novosphingobium marinum TaxID=1514948 RepID=A0A7Y9Y0H2_9SPHN|nr:TonB-dependent receptor [Novosphingobium marinum]NYH96463.1 outer membrane receptor protein involved in Fe transport [Novosphingobium marinum]GGC35428.1 TonB-dependent receptor [Novosphingobium marinum]